jgi:hypothetical protein
MKTITGSIATLFACTLLAACSPYSPDLSPAPFSCGNTEPRCPDNYTCNTVTDLCVAGSGTGADASPDGGPFICDNDSAVEPNDMISNARQIPTTTPLGTAFKFSQLAICPALDKDTYQVSVAANATNIEVVVDFAGGAPLAVSILNSSGTPSVTGTVVNRQIKATLANASAGEFFVQVSGSGQNNYSISITQRR